MNWLPGFTTPLLLIGLAAAAIPFLLHLLSSIKAQEVYFPTLRFLRKSMEKTARRRRIQHWLLLLLRALLLAFLAIAAAEPFAEATGGWLAGRSYAAVIILDNSFSMMAERRGGGADQEGRTRLEVAQREAVALLTGPNRPTRATVMTTCPPDPMAPPDAKDPKRTPELTAEVLDLAEVVQQTRIGFGRARLADRVKQAVELLQRDNSPQKSIYILSDMQQVSFDKLADLKELAAAEDIHLLVVDTSGADKDRNVAVTDVAVVGKYVLNQRVTVRATLVNSSSAPVKFEAILRIDGRDELGRQTGTLGPTAEKIIEFEEKLSLDRGGAIRGEVFVKVDGEDLLPLDNVRRFSLEVAGRVNVLVVAGPARAGTPPELAPAAMLTTALDPFGDRRGRLWSVAPRTVDAETFAPGDLADVDAAFFCNVPSFTPRQAQGMLQFARAGGTVVIFPGPDTDAANYNQRLVAEAGLTPLMPRRLGEAVGQVGPTAEARRVDWVDTEHPYLAGLHEEMSDYLGIRVQRYFRLVKGTGGGRTLLRLARGPADDGHDPLLIVDRCGAGRTVFCTTTASRRWTNLPVTHLFLPAVVRISLQARRGTGRNNTYVADRPVIIRPPARRGGPDEQPVIVEGAKIEITAPMATDLGKSDALTATFSQTAQGLGATFDRTDQLGVYSWRPAGAGADGPGGQFVVNPDGRESRLQSVTGSGFREALADKGIQRVYVTDGVKDATAAALADTEDDPWWDILLAAAIVLLVVEALVANRQRRRHSDEAVPAHLNPRMASRHSALRASSEQ